MQFKHPELLYFLFLLVIPILVHLFQLRKFKKEYSNEFRTQYFTHQKPYFGFSSDKNEKLDQLNKLSIYAKSKRAWSFAGYIQEEIDELERNQGKDEINQARSQAHKRTDHKNKKIDRNPYLRRKYIKTGSMLLALSGVLATLVVLNHFAIINVPPISLIICLSATIIASAWQFWSAWRTSKGDDIKVDKKLEDPSIKNAESSHEEKAQQKPYSSPQR